MKRHVDDHRLGDVAGAAFKWYQALFGQPVLPSWPMIYFRAKILDSRLELFCSALHEWRRPTKHPSLMSSDHGTPRAKRAPVVLPCR